MLSARAVNDCNGLPTEVVSSPTVNIFKAAGLMPIGLLSGTLYQSQIETVGTIQAQLEQDLQALGPFIMAYN